MDNFKQSVRSVNPPGQSHHIQPVRWRLVVEGQTPTPYLTTLGLSESDFGEQVMIYIVRKYRHCITSRSSRLLNRIVLFRRPTIERVTFAPVSNSDLEAQNLPCHVRILSREVDEILTQAFYRPEILTTATGFVKENSQFAENDASTPETRHALSINLAFDATAACWTLAFVVFVAMCSGLVVGLIYRSANVGMAVTSGVSAWISCVEALLIWRFR